MYEATRRTKPLSLSSTFPISLIPRIYYANNTRTLIYIGIYIYRHIFGAENHPHLLPGGTQAFSENPRELPATELALRHIMCECISVEPSYWKIMKVMEHAHCIYYPLCSASLLSYKSPRVTHPPLHQPPCNSWRTFLSLSLSLSCS